MRPPISWSDLKGSRVGVWGLGVEGLASIRKLQSLGVEPVLVDDRPSSEPVEGLGVHATGDGGLGLLAGCDYVVKTPGISRYRPEAAQLEGAGVAVVGGLGLWLQEADRDRVVLVTGTKGKSTTSSILAHLMEGLGLTVFVGGNLGYPPYSPDAATDADFWVIETSSYQAADLAVSPPVVAVTSLHADHLPWHGDRETYFRDKLSACSQPGARLTIANGDDPLLRERRAELGPEVEWVLAPEVAPLWFKELGIPGRHNLLNALIARASLRALGVEADDEALFKAGRWFPGLASRLQLIGSVEGVDFVDDSLSTNVLSTVAALSVYPDRRLALLAGGHDRGIDYTELGEYLIRRKEPTLLVTLPETGPKIAAAVQAAGPGEGLEVVSCDDLSDATRSAFRWARPDGVVLLSPAAASFGGFRDYRHRAAVFAEEKNRLAGEFNGSC